MNWPAAKATRPASYRIPNSATASTSPVTKWPARWCSSTSSRPFPDALQARGVQEPRLLLAQLFGRDTIGMSQEQRNTRIRLVRQVALPVALGLLRVCEQDSDVHLDQTCTLGISSNLPWAMPRQTAGTKKTMPGTKTPLSVPAPPALRPQQSTLMP